MARLLICALVCTASLLLGCDDSKEPPADYRGLVHDCPDIMPSGKTCRPEAPQAQPPSGPETSAHVPAEPPKFKFVVNHEDSDRIAIRENCHKDARDPEHKGQGIPSGDRVRLTGELSPEGWTWAVHEGRTTCIEDKWLRDKTVEAPQPVPTQPTVQKYEALIPGTDYTSARWITCREDSPCGDREGFFVFAGVTRSHGRQPMALALSPVHELYHEIVELHGNACGEAFLSSKLMDKMYADQIGARGTNSQEDEDITLRDVVDTHDRDAPSGPYQNALEYAKVDKNCEVYARVHLT